MVRLSVSFFIFLSFVSTALTIANAFFLKKQFYPSVVYLTKSNTSMAVIYFQAAVLSYMVFSLLRWIFFGQLRVAEIEHAQERVWHAIMETCLAFTVFRDDFSPKFVVQFVVLFFIKAFHWLAEDRVDYMERSPMITVLFHARIMGILSLLSALDSYFISHAFFTTLLKGASAQVVFGFEYAVLLTMVAHITIKYILHIHDLRSQHPWENKAVYMLYSELFANFLRCALYLFFAVVMIKIHTFPLFAIRPFYLTVRALQKAVNDVIQSRRAINAMNNLFPLATAQELADGDNTCIICREEMTVESGAKKLPCNHIFHPNCLRSWFQRQQTCPTCRTDILAQRRPNYVIPGANGANGNNNQQQQPQNLQNHLAALFNQQQAVGGGAAAIGGGGLFNIQFGGGAPAVNFAMPPAFMLNFQQQIQQQQQLRQNGGHAGGQQQGAAGNAQTGQPPQQQQQGGGQQQVNFNMPMMMPFGGFGAPPQFHFGGGPPPFMRFMGAPPPPQQQGGVLPTQPQQSSNQAQSSASPADSTATVSDGDSSAATTSSGSGPVGGGEQQPSTSILNSGETGGSAGITGGTSSPPSSAQQQSPSASYSQPPQFFPFMPPFHGAVPPPPMPFPQPPEFAGFSDAEIAEMEGRERTAVESRIQALRNISVLLDAAMLQFQQYSSIASIWSAANVASPPTTVAASAPASNASASFTTLSTGQQPVASSSSDEQSPSTSANTGVGDSVTKISTPIASTSAAENDCGASSSATIAGGSMSADEVRRRRLAKFQAEEGGGSSSGQ